ncbi:hypothetical protein CTA1_12937, partial [Colletotrichum tanaceti]
DLFPAAPAPYGHVHRSGGRPSLAHIQGRRPRAMLLAPVPGARPLLLLYPQPCPLPPLHHLRGTLWRIVDPLPLSHTVRQRGEGEARQRAFAMYGSTQACARTSHL